MAQISVGGGRHHHSAKPDAVERLVVQQHALVHVLDECMETQHCAVLLHHRVGTLGNESCTFVIESFPIQEPMAATQSGTAGKLGGNRGPPTDSQRLPVCCRTVIAHLLLLQSQSWAAGFEEVRSVAPCIGECAVQPGECI